MNKLDDIKTIKNFKNINLKDRNLIIFKNYKNFKYKTLNMTFCQFIIILSIKY
jgi:hypothetical protein